MGLRLGGTQRGAGGFHFPPDFSAVLPGTRQLLARARLVRDVNGRKLGPRHDRRRALEEYMFRVDTGQQAVYQGACMVWSATRSRWSRADTRRRRHLPAVGTCQLVLGEDKRLRGRSPRRLAGKWFLCAPRARSGLLEEKPYLPRARLHTCARLCECDYRFRQPRAVRHVCDG